MSFTDYLENELLDHILNDGAWTAPTNPYVGLSTTTPTEAADGDGGGNFTEPSGGAYARVSTSAATWDAAAAGSKDNGSAITFVQATASWGTVTHFGIFDAATSGNCLLTATLTASRTVGNGDTAEFAAGSLAVTLD